MQRRLSQLLRTLASTAPLLAATAGATPLAPGDVVVADAVKVLRVDPVTGDRTVFSSALVGSGPPLSAWLESLVVEDSGSLLVADVDNQAIVRIDPVTGDRTVVASSTVGSGGAFRPLHLGTTFDGDIVVIDAPDLADRRTIVRVDPVTGDRAVVSSPSVGSGPAFTNLRAIFRGPGPFVYVADGIPGSRLFRVDLATGDRTIVSSATKGSGPPFTAISDVAYEGGGNLLVTDPIDDAVVRVNTVLGDRTVVTSGSVGTGPALMDPVQVWPAPDGSLLVLDWYLASIFRVDPTTGDRTTFSSAFVGNGRQLFQPQAIAMTRAPKTLFGFESEMPGSPPLNTAINDDPIGAITVEAAAGFSPPLAAPEGSQLLYATTGPGTGAGTPIPVDFSGDGNGETDLGFVTFRVERSMNEPRHLHFAYDVLTSEITGGNPDPVQLELFGGFEGNWSIGADNGNFTALTGFGGGPLTGPDGSSFVDGGLGFQTVTFPVDLGGWTLVLFIGDEIDDQGDTALLLDDIRLLPEPSGVAPLASGLALLSLLGRARQRG